jgi:hypothetical protein
VRHIVVSIAAIAAMLSSNTALADSTGGDAAVQAFGRQNEDRLALATREHNLKSDLGARLAFYHPLAANDVGHINDIAILRLRLIEAQQAADIASQAAQESQQNTVVGELAITALGPDAPNILQRIAEYQAGPGVTPALLQPLAGDMTLAVYNRLNTGTTKVVSGAQSTTCQVLSYLTSTYATAAPQFTSSTTSAGQKNTLTFVGFGLGIPGFILGCTQSHTTN